MKAKEQHNVYAQQVERLRAEKVELNKEIKATETKAYKAFCKTAKVENMNERNKECIKSGENGNILRKKKERMH